MIDSTRFTVGQPWPYPLAGEGLQAACTPGPDGLGLLLVAGLSSPRPTEVRALTKEPIRLAILPSPPLVWIVLLGQKIAFDAPYGVGLGSAGHPERVVAAASMAASWPPDRRGLATIAMVDTDTRLITGIRAISLSRAWWCALADGLAACPTTLSPAAYDAAIDRDMRRWPDTADMARAATITEIAGRV